MTGIRKLGWLLAVVVLCAVSMQGQNVLRVQNLRCEYKVNPIGIDAARPRLSWRLDSSEKNVLQTSYELRVAGSEENLAKGKYVWTTGTVESDASAGVEYAGPALETGRR